MKQIETIRTWPASQLKTKNTMDGRKRADINIGQTVEIVLKKDQSSGNLTKGVVQRILTSSPNHHHGIKVKLESGDVGRVKNILIDDED